MIEIGDELIFKVECVNHHEEGYCFLLKNCKIKDNFDFNIKLSKTDPNYNQQIQDILEKCKGNKIKRFLTRFFCK
jgi:hypothetical protein